MSRRPYTISRLGPVIIILFLASSVILYRHPFSLSPPSPTHVDAHAILSHVPDDHSTKAFTFNNDNGMDENELAIIGRKATSVPLDGRDIIDVVTQDKLSHSAADVFNLSLLKLPRGSKWGFLGVARGPPRQLPWMKMAGVYETIENVLVIFGLNATRHGELFLVTRAETLDLKMDFKEACHSSGSLYHGAEDPRLFWTDAGTPALIYGRYSNHGDMCRGVAVVEDMRDLYAPLDDALVSGHGVAPWGSIRKLGGQGVDRELFKEQGQHKVEKNWSPFFAGPTSDQTSILPHIHYSVVPKIALSPSSSNAHQVSYVDIPSSPSFDGITQGHCIEHHHPHYPWDKFHQSTPLYRVTLCERGCTPGVGNTVYMTIVQAQKLGPPTLTYRKFIVVFNTTSPYDMISVGPMFMLNGLSENAAFVYALSMTPLEPSDLDGTISPRPHVPGTNPAHFFIDDDAIISLGVADRLMSTSVVPVRDLLARQRRCKSESGGGGGE